MKTPKTNKEEKNNIINSSSGTGRRGVNILDKKFVETRFGLEMPIPCLNGSNNTTKNPPINLIICPKCGCKFI